MSVEATRWVHDIVCQLEGLLLWQLVTFAIYQAGQFLIDNASSKGGQMLSTDGLSGGADTGQWWQVGWQRHTRLVHVNDQPTELFNCIAL